LVELESIDSYLDGKDPVAVSMFRRFEELVRACGPSEVAPRSSIVYWKRERVFAGAFIQHTRLELNVDLLREAEHERLLAAFPMT
jgi:hypothetical protein